MTKTHLGIAGMVLLLGIGASIGLRYRTSTPSTTQSAIATSFYPIYFITQRITGDTMPVISITPPGTEPHEYEPTPRATADLLASPLFIHTGGALEPWAERIAALRAKNNLPSLALITRENGILHSTSTAEDDTDSEEHATPYDPHIWLSPLRAQGLTARIAAELIRLDTANTAAYTANAVALGRELATLDTAYRTTLAQCAERTLVTDHDAFGYIAADYNLSTLAIRGISPEDEPTPQTLASIATYVRTNGITHILTEELVSPAVAETIARETGATLAQLSTIEGLTEADEASGATYLTKLRDNLATLKTALRCR